MTFRSLVIRCAETAARAGSASERLVVLVFHRVLQHRDAMYPDHPDAATFSIYMRTLAEDFEVLPLREALQLQEQGRLPPGSVAVTFDDGFADNETVALPVLRRFGVHATFFVASGYLGNGFMFDDAVIEACRQVPAGTWLTGVPELGDIQVAQAAGRRQLADQLISRLKYLDPVCRTERARQLLESAAARVPAGLMMTAEQVRSLHAAGMEIGGHTRGHPILAVLGDGAAEAEIAGGRADLEDIIGHPLALFAYPNGRPGLDYGPRDVELVRRLGFRAAVSAATGYSDRRTDRFQIPRVGTWGNSAWKFSARLAVTRARNRGQGCETARNLAGGA